MQVPHLEIAHRGYSSAAPENTVAAFKTAVEKMVVAIEVDLMLSKDGVIVVSHDYNLETWTDGEGEISEKTWAELSQVTVTRGGKIRSPSIVKGVDDKLARFSDVLDAAIAHNLQIVLELKTVYNSSHLIRTVANMLKEKNYISNTLVTSFLPGMLLEFQRYAPETYTLLLYSSTAFRTFCTNAPAGLRSSLFFTIACAYPAISDSIASYVIEPLAKICGAGAVGIDIQNPHVSSLATRALGWGLNVVIWTVNSIPQRELVRAIKGNERGVIGIMSDCPLQHCPAEH